MIRRLAVVGIATSLTALLGCGLVQSRLPTPQSLRPGAVTRTFDARVMKVMDAAAGTGGDEILFDADAFDFDFALNSRSARGKNFEIPGDPAKGPVFVDSDSLPVQWGKITGKTKNGRPVTLWFLARDDDRKTELTLFIGRTGDLALSNAYLDRIANRLAHPIVRTPEEIEKRKIKVEFDGFSVLPDPKSASKPDSKVAPTQPIGGNPGPKISEPSLLPGLDPSVKDQ